MSTLLCSGGPHLSSYTCVKLVTDPYGNYVVRKAMDVDGGMVADVMEKAVEVFRGSVYAKRVVKKIDRDKAIRENNIY